MDTKRGAPSRTVDKPNHVKGIKQGNSKGNYEHMTGHRADGTSKSARSTGIRPKSEEPIAPSMPNLSPG